MCISKLLLHNVFYVSLLSGDDSLSIPHVRCPATHDKNLKDASSLMAPAIEYPHAADSRVCQSIPCIVHIFSEMSLFSPYPKHKRNLHNVTSEFPENCECMSQNLLTLSLHTLVCQLMTHLL